MTKPNRGIRIGEEQWIAFIDLTGRYERAVPIDEQLSVLEAFWSELETNCVAGCCSIDAFSFWPADIQRASSIVDRTFLMEQLASLLDFARRSEADVFISERMNNYFDRHVLLQLIEHIHAHAKS